ncbi:hypothetical protein [Thermococcus sp. JCM 11816]|uniref:hypothetical protein n=1 Tax=Thermococcus sp. (strain JCM 11816 / KS-1) TaxID=1295125 RepID=UPI00346741A8
MDGVLIKKSAVTVYAYHTWEYKMYNVWRATPGSHVLTARFVPDYGGKPVLKLNNAQSFRVQAVHLRGFPHDAR